MVKTSLWATHELRCTDCNTTFPVAYGGKAKGLKEFAGVSEKCPNCEIYTPCIDSRYESIAEAKEDKY
jgi:formate dehydrogenase maturation protein FdhE